MEILLFWLVIGPLVGAAIASAKGRSKAEGALLGLLLGFIGWLIEAVLASQPSPGSMAVVYGAPDYSRLSSQAGPQVWNGQANGIVMRPCRSCGLSVPVGAGFCPGCGSDQGGALRCLRCAAVSSPGAMFCPGCGLGLRPLGAA